MRKKRLREYVKFPATYRLRIIVILTMGFIICLSSICPGSVVERVE